MKIKVPHVFLLLAGVILVCSIATYLIPSGEYEREEMQIGSLTRTVVVPGTFTEKPKHLSLKGVTLGDEVEGKASPVSILGYLTSIPRGLEKSADIIFFCFILGGVFNVIQRTGTISAFIQALISRFSTSAVLLVVVVMFVVGVGGSTIGMGEELIPLVPVFLLLSKELGFDRIVAMAMVSLAAEMGFAAATTNPFTVQIAQGIAEVPLGSGLGFRIVFFFVIMAVTTVYVLRYALRIRKDPTKSLLYGTDANMDDVHVDHVKLESRHYLIMGSSILIFMYILYAVQQNGWWLNEMAGGFILMGLVAVIISGLKTSEAMQAFVKGLEDMVIAALVIGFARGIQVVLEDGQILDSVIYYVSGALNGFPRVVGAEGMLLFQTFLNFFIPSGSGQAAATMPLMAPLADVLGLTRQTAIFAFTCGDGFSNTIVPTSGILMAMLGIAKVPYTKWLKFVLPLFLLLMGVSAIFLAIAVYIGY